MLRNVTGTHLSKKEQFWYEKSGCVLCLVHHIVASRHSPIAWLCSTFLDICFPFSEYLGEISHLVLHLYLPGFPESGSNIIASEI